MYNDRNRMLQEELERTNVELANLQYRYDGFMQGMDMLRRVRLNATLEKNALSIEVAERA